MPTRPDPSRESPARGNHGPTRSPERPLTVPTRAPVPGGGAAALLNLQRSVGNAAVVQALAAARDSAPPQGSESRGHEPGVQREPSVQRDPPGAGTGDLDTRRPVGGAVPAAERAQVFDPLQRSPRAQTIMAEIRRIRGDLAFPVRWSSRGTYQVSGEIWLDRTWTTAQNIVAVQHEITHLLTQLSGGAPNIATMTRDAYVAAQMVDEINAHAAGYVVHLQLATAGAEPQGFAAFRTFLTSNHAAVLRRRDYAQIETLARTWVEARYRAGDPGWRTSNTDENYYTYWGKAWDAAHPAGP